MYTLCDANTKKCEEVIKIIDPIGNRNEVDLTVAASNVKIGPKVLARGWDCEVEEEVGKGTIKRDWIILERLNPQPSRPIAPTDYVRLALDKYLKLVQWRIVQNDLKPDNIMFDRDNNMKIVDYGEAKRLDRVAEPAELGAIIKDAAEHLIRFMTTQGTVGPNPDWLKKLNPTERTERYLDLVDAAQQHVRTSFPTATIEPEPYERLTGVLEPHFDNGLPRFQDYLKLLRARKVRPSPGEVPEQPSKTTLEREQKRERLQQAAKETEEAERKEREEEEKRLRRVIEQPGTPTRERKYPVPPRIPPTPTLPGQPTHPTPAELPGFPEPLELPELPEFPELPELGRPSPPTIPPARQVPSVTRLDDFWQELQQAPPAKLQWETIQANVDLVFLDVDLKQVIAHLPAYKKLITEIVLPRFGWRNSRYTDAIEFQKIHRSISGFALHRFLNALRFDVKDKQARTFVESLGKSVWEWLQTPFDSILRDFVDAELDRLAQATDAAYQAEQKYLASLQDYKVDDKAKLAQSVPSIAKSVRRDTETRLAQISASVRIHELFSRSVSFIYFCLLKLACLSIVIIIDP